MTLPLPRENIINKITRSKTMANDIKYEIERTIGVISQSASGWSKELNLVSWNGNPPKFDIRDWSPDHSKMGKGITLTDEEFGVLARLINFELESRG